MYDKVANRDESEGMHHGFQYFHEKQECATKALTPLDRDAIQRIDTNAVEFPTQPAEPSSLSQQQLLCQSVSKAKFQIAPPRTKPHHQQVPMSFDCCPSLALQTLCESHVRDHNQHWTHATCQ